MSTSSARDFDFLMGHWRVAHRRLRRRLAGDDVWDDFGGTCDARPLLAGAGNVDDNLLHLPSGPYRAAGFRAFDASSRQWAIWWLDARDPHRLDPPMIGAFEDGIGTFLADDIFDGRPIRVRFRWTATDTATPRWDQAFSPDDGLTWEVNWEMTFARAG